MNLGKAKIRAVLLVALTLGLLPFLSGDEARADVAALRAELENRQSKIAELEQEIAAYQEQIEKEASNAQTLTGEIRRVEATINKLKADIRLTTNRIAASELTIEEISDTIAGQEVNIGERREAIGTSLRTIGEIEAQSLVEILLANANLSVFFSSLNDLERLEEELRVDMLQLQELNKQLRAKKDAKEKEKTQMESLRLELADRSRIEEQAKRSKDRLLSETKNREVAYQQLLEDRLQKKNALEEELRGIEEEIRIAIDPESLPQTGSGVLMWPLDEVKITQYFGNTTFATANPQIYNGKGHNGIDLRASPGTLVKAAEEGVVVGIGNTDEQCNGVSYGKWVLIEHQNNLSTLYAHLSLSRARMGERVFRGDIIGYSGNTGYTTGPHLHFAVFASKGVRVDQYRSRVCGTLMTLPLASYNSYLNPLSYL
ncbi:MAG: peptidoglycan DD-metalloendopeptidase family protein [Parcubacteria group bacterium]|nr:peptidoglycan DD-metalloendopeptidase family protein [Parcubacteria group bacterium]